MDVDYRDSTLTSEQRKPDEAKGTSRWWQADSGELRAQAITAVLDALYKRQGIRRAQLVMSSKLYGNFSMLGMSGMSFAKVAALNPALKDRISYNLAQSCVDAITSKMAKNKPKPEHLTSGGDFALARRAKNLNKFAQGIFHENQAYRFGPILFRDACVFGDGVAHVFGGPKGRVTWERVLASELYVDELEGFYGDPRSLHRAKNVDRDVLLGLPKLSAAAKAIIARADRAEDDGEGNYALSDMVQVRASWHLPSSPGAGDGLRVLSIAEGELYSEPWTHDFFPFARLQWSPRLHGFWGQGLVEQIQNLQFEINKLLFVIQKSMHLAGSFKVFLHTTSKVVSEHVNNNFGSIIKWSGNQRPEYVTPPVVQPEIYSHLSTLIERGFEQSGVSMLSASSRKPAGLNSGKALREYNDIESDRFMTVGQQYENFFLDLDKLSIATVQDIVEGGGKYEVRVPGARSLEVVDWREIKLDSEQYLSQCYPVSSLADEPAERLEDLQEFAQAGLIEPEEIRGLMNFPDLERSDSLANAAREVITKTLEDIIEHGESVPPEPFDNLALALKLASQYYAYARLQSVPEERLELLRVYMTQVKALMAAAMPPAPVAPGPQPQAVPAPSPVSQLLPNAPGGPANA